MNKIIPFNKDITFQNEVGEITSIALEDNLSFTDSYTIGGELTVRGVHKNQELEEDFSYTLPVIISVDEKYDTKDAKISVDDFYYEIINNGILRVKIDLLLDGLMYKEEERIDNIDFISDKGENLNIDFSLEKEDDKLNIDTVVDANNKDLLQVEMKDNADAVNTKDLFPINEEEKEYSIYRVYAINEGDTLQSILDKYKVSKEELEIYNDLSNLTVGTKLIIPSKDE